MRMIFGVVFVGLVVAGAAQTGPVPQATPPTAQVPTAKVPQPSVPTAQVPTATVPTVQAPQSPLPMGQVQRIVDIMTAEGLTAKASSIHVNGWFGGYDKLSTSRQMMAEEFAIDLDAAREQFVFAGDSPNDQPMFEFFPNAVGVANVREMEELMTRLPAWVTPSRGSLGFAELAEALLAAR